MQGYIYVIYIKRKQKNSTYLGTLGKILEESPKNSGATIAHGAFGEVDFFLAHGASTHVPLGHS